MTPGTILVSSARSGTNYFLSVWAALFPGDVVLKEIFRPQGDSLHRLEPLLGLPRPAILDLVARDPLALWQQVTGRAAQGTAGGGGRRGSGPGGAAAAMAKVFYYHVAPENPLWARFRDHDRVIHLVRRNVFDAHVSRRVAQQTGQWQSLGRQDSPVAVQPLVIDRAEAEAHIAATRAHVAWAREVLGAGGRMTEVHYEDIAASPAACAAAIAAICGLDRVPERLDIHQRRQKQLPNSALVSNYAEVADLDIPVFGPLP